MIIELKKKLAKKETIVCMVAMSHGGLSLPEVFLKCLKVIGYDINREENKWWQPLVEVKE